MRASDLIKGYIVSIGSLFAGASVVHWVFQPDLRLQLPEKSDTKPNKNN
jgi:hypothetical protein